MAHLSSKETERRAFLIKSKLVVVRIWKAL